LQEEIREEANYSEMMSYQDKHRFIDGKKSRSRGPAFFYISRGGASEAGRFYLLFSAL
jgi:hypothetical protein